MTGRIDRINRIVLTLLGIVVLGAGVAGLLVGAGVFGSSAAHTALVTDATRSYAHRNAGWYWGAFAGSAVLVAVLALWWLIAQSGSSRVASLQLEIDRSRGTTRLLGTALTAAVEDDVAAYHDVENATARLLGSSREPILRLDVAIAESADIPALRLRLETEAIPRARQAASVHDLPVWLRLDIATGRSGPPGRGDRVARDVH